MGSTEKGIHIADDASILEARAIVKKLGEQVGLSKEDIQRMAIVVSALGKNQLRYARKAKIFIREIEKSRPSGIEILALDQDRGIEDPRAALLYGLSGVIRLADEVDFDIRLEEGTRIWARKFVVGRSASACQLAIFGRPIPGGIISGDHGIFLRSDRGFLAAVVDGLGHGPHAREASNQIVDCIQKTNTIEPVDILETCNQIARSGRGAVVAILRYDDSDKQISYAGLGDVKGQLCLLGQEIDFENHPGILGGKGMKVQHFRQEVAHTAPGAVLAVFTDGLETCTSLQKHYYAQDDFNLLRQPAIVIAQYLVNRFGRTTDDALVFVVRFGNVTPPVRPYKAGTTK